MEWLVVVDTVCIRSRVSAAYYSVQHSRAPFIVSAPPLTEWVHVPPRTLKVTHYPGTEQSHVNFTTCQIFCTKQTL